MNEDSVCLLICVGCSCQHQISFFPMGNSKSQQFSTLFSPLRPHDWQVVQEKETYQLWKRRSDSRVFMAYPLNETLIDSQEKLQLYNFRKLNHSSLVSVDSILSHEEEYLCSLPKSKHILVENIPFTLTSFRHTFTITEAMTILSAAFAGYNTLNYVYGPLFTDEQMIGFSEQGVPKVWVNPNFSSNQPSSFAVNGGDAQPTSLEERTYCCVQRILDVVELSMAGAYPYDFRQEAGQVASFAEGEELVENYCRQRGIPLDDRVPLNKLSKVEPLKFRTDSYQLTQRVSLNTYPLPTGGNAWAIGSNEGNGDISTLQYQHPTYYQYSPFQPSSISQISVTQQPLIRSTVSGTTRVNFVFSTAANSLLTENSPTVPITIQKQTNSVSVEPIQPKIEPPRQEQSLIVSEHSGDREEKTIQVTVPIVNEPPQISNVENSQEIKLNFHPNTLHESSEQNEQQQYQLKVHEVIQNEEQEDPQQEEQPNKAHQSAQPQLISPQLQQTTVQAIAQPPILQHAPDVNRIPTSESVEEGVMRSMQSQYRHSEPFDELKKWEESLLKLSAKQQKSHNRQKSVDANDSQEQYLSEEKDKVHIDSPTRQIHLFNTQSELEAYVRNKYKGFFAAEQTQIDQVEGEDQANNYQATAIRESGIDSTSHFNPGSQVQVEPETVTQPHPQPQPQLNKVQNSSKFSSDEFDQRKYTFGKIEIDPASAKQQYKKAVEKEISVPDRQKRSKFMVGSIQLNTLEDRYSKYVKNRESRSRFYSKDISSILKPEDSSINKIDSSLSKVDSSLNKIDSSLNKIDPSLNKIDPSLKKIDIAAHEYLRESTNTDRVRSFSSKPRQKDGLTYDKLRELLWA